METTDFSARLSTHEQEHSKGIAAYNMLNLLLRVLESNGQLDPSTTRHVADALISAVRKIRIEENKEDEHARRLYSAVIADIEALAKRDDDSMPRQHPDL